MTFAYKKQVLYDNRIYDIESITMHNGQAYADATYKVHGITHMVGCDDIRIALARGLRN